MRGIELRGPAAVASAAQVFVSDLESLAMSRDDANHLSRVLRLRSGEPVVACDGAGSWCLCRYRVDSKSQAPLLEAAGTVSHEPAPTRPVVVGFVPVKGERPELVVQKLTELGVDTIALLRSARQVVRWEAPRAERAVSKLRRVAREAAAQSRRARLPDLVGPMSLAELAEHVAPAELTLAHPGGDPPSATTSVVAVGPEGGWDDTELATGRPAVGLAPGVLRAETAAIAAGFLLCALRDRVVGEADSAPPSGLEEA
ncbi:MAG: RsmE family RNA methyltransferase [Acidimicrobiales bacterium]